jgi:hypothetical protein
VASGSSGLLAGACPEKRFTNDDDLRLCASPTPAEDGSGEKMLSIELRRRATGRSKSLTSGIDACSSGQPQRRSEPSTYRYRTISSAATLALPWGQRTDLLRNRVRDTQIAVGNGQQVRVRYCRGRQHEDGVGRIAPQRRVRRDRHLLHLRPRRENSLILLPKSVLVLHGSPIQRSLCTVIRSGNPQHGFARTRVS